MNPENNHLSPYWAIPEAKRKDYTPVPSHLQKEAARELAGKIAGYVNPSRGALSTWAANQRKKARAKAKGAKASRKRNRVT